MFNTVIYRKSHL